MGSMEKIAIGRQMGGFMKARRGTRPLRVDTLLDRSSEPPESHRNLWVESPVEESEAADLFAEGLAHTEGEEFGAEPEPKIDPILSRIAKEGFAFRETMGKESAELRSQLLPHQQRVVKRMRKQPGLVVAHGTGQGKTLASIGAVVDLNPDKARVFAPAALQENYKKEIKKHVKGNLPVEIQTIEKAVRSGKPPRGDMFVIDEAHRFRNPGGKGHQLLAGTNSKKMLLTASPVYNKPEDVAALVNLAAGEKRLPVGKEFDKRYIQQPGTGLFSIINPWASREPKVVKRKELGRVLNKWVDYERGNNEGFPSLSEERVNVPMSKRQTALHAAALGRLPARSRLMMMQGYPPKKDDIAKLNLFQSQTRQVSSSEGKYTVGEYDASPKVNEAVGRLAGKLKTDKNHKALVYANYLGTLDDYSRKLKAKKVPHAMFRGDMSRKVRDVAVEDLNAGRIKALLVSGAGGEGLDLKGIKQVQVLEPHWNDEKLRQVIGRARRYKSHDSLPEKERHVHVERYAARPRGMLWGTKPGIEDMLYDMSDQKQRLNDQVMDLIANPSS